MSFSCPHFDVDRDFCLRLNKYCVPGRPGCVLGATAVFAVPVEERIRAKDEEKRLAGALPPGASDDLRNSFS